MATRRAWRVPEALQASASDCGPAALQSLAAGFGLKLRLDRLREVCQTDVDGTSIDALEDVARELGLEAEQVLLPPEHVLPSAGDALPAVALVRRPGGLTHFVVAWRAHAGRVQVMDPAGGRLWTPGARFLDSLHLHEQAVPAEAWREWAGGAELRAGLLARLRALRVTVGAADAFLARALADPTWRSLAALLAGARFVERLAPRARPSGIEAQAVFDALLARVVQGGDPALPEECWSVRPGEDGTLLFRGAVLLRVRGLRPAVTTAGDEERPARLRDGTRAQVLAGEPGLRPHVLAALKTAGAPLLATLAAGLVAGTLGVACEGLLFGLLLDPAAWRLPPFDRGALLAAVALLPAMLLWLDLAGAWTWRRLGRRLEAGLRAAFLRAVPRLGEPYLRGRPRADLVERAHAAFLARELPAQCAHACSAVCRLALYWLALAWLYRDVALPAALAALTAVALPLVAQPRLVELELRLRALAAALAAFPLEALLGLVPLRVHGLERAWRREHDDVLARWLDAGFERQRRAVALQVLQWGLDSALVTWAVVGHARGQGAAGLLLLAYWGLRLPDAGAELGQALMRLPRQRAALRRLLEPLDAQPPPAPPVQAPTAPATSAVSLRLRSAGLTLGGRAVLAGLDLDLTPGRHVALLGPSGAGKSTLIGVLLGWYALSEGEFSIDDAPADASALERLRAATAWVDPQVRLWNRSLHENLRYGAPDAPTDLAETLAACGARPLLERLPEGLRTPLGEGGGRVAGGEGQRVRLARALLRGPARLALLDEPFRGLPRDERLALQRLARERWRQAALVCVTHDVESSAEFDEIWLLEGGRLAERGAPAELLRGDTRYAAWLRAERELRAGFDDRARFRRLRLEQGRLVEERGA